MKRTHDTFFISGSMFGNKSKRLIELINIAKEEKIQFLVFKPTNDTRDGLFVKSRSLEQKVPAIGFDVKSEDRFEHFKKQLTLLNSYIKPKAVFFDEIHFMSLEDVKRVVQLCKVKKIAVFMSGLETSFKKEYFPSAKWLKENVKYYSFNHGRCNGCELEEAVYNVLYDNGKIVTEGADIQPGDEEYKVFCETCFNTL